MHGPVEEEGFWPWFDGVKDKLGNRERTFEKTFRYLDTIPSPITIIETGCMRKDPDTEDAWVSDGVSTLLFDRYVQDRGGRIYSVDLDRKATDFCRRRVSHCVQLHTGDSIQRLRGLARAKANPDLVYLDSYDWLEQEPFLAALHCANEFEAIRPALRPSTLVVCDDTPGAFIKEHSAYMELRGKGAFVAKHADAVGAELLFAEWQIGWTGMAGRKRAETFGELDQQITDMVERARAHVEGNRAINAERLYRGVLILTANQFTPLQRVARGEACAFYARVAAMVGATGTAGDWYTDALKSDPRCVEYRIEMIYKSLRPSSNFKLARQEAQRCTALEPDNPAAWRALGDAEMALCDEKRAAAAYDEQLMLKPDDPDAMLDRCVIALDTEDYPLAGALAAKAMECGRRADGLHVMAMIANRKGRHEDAIKLYDSAIAGGCMNAPTAHWNKSLSLHAIGRYREGWIEHEYRKHDSNPALSLAYTRFNRPLYEGQEPVIDGRAAVLLVHAEAGMGDNIAFSRFLNHFDALGFAVRYEAMPDMVELMRRSFPVVEVVPRAPDYPGAVGLKQFDYHLPLGSMAHALGVDIDTVPAPRSYLIPDPEKVAGYAAGLRAHGHGGRKIGLCWSSGIREYGLWIKRYGRRKSMRLVDMLGLAIGHENGLASIAADDTLISLQVGPEREELNGWPEAIDLLPAIPDWDDTAALVANLDLVITVDTAVAHLAGALGIPTWVLMQQDGASWHFMSERPGSPWNTRSPWYPSVRIFRQKAPGDWNAVIDEVSRALVLEPVGA